ncbi:MAG TPA: zinc metallopeptidase [Firmicutes bacterium]|nr:zinc metallopeptidase [Candidatus Fermentithermobacillaceae bacterium]
MMLFDQGYWLFVIPAMFFALWAQAKVQSAFNTYSRLQSRTGRTGVEVAAALLRSAGLGDVRIERQRGHLTDHYDPRTRTLRLSDSTYNSSSVAAIAIAAHEVGHAVQHSVGYAPLAVRNGLVPVAQFTSQAAFPLFFIGLFTNSGFLMDLGILFFLGAVLFQAITLPVEFNASSRAMDMLQVSGLVAPAEEGPMRNMLSAAALTYVAGLAVAVAQLLRLLVLRGSRDRD